MKKIDEGILKLAEYAYHASIDSQEAYKTALASLGDSLGCALLALQFPACTKLLGPIAPGTTVPNGCRVPGTTYILDPVLGAFNIGAMIRWLDYNDTWLAAEWGHPSDNLGGLLAVSDYLCRSGSRITVEELLTAQIKAYEIQGGLALLNSFNRVGFDHVIFVKVATAALATVLFGGSLDQVINAISNAWVDTGPLRTYRHAPNAGSRKSWAAGDATSRGVFLAHLSMKGEMGYPTALSAKQWGLYDVLFKGKPFQFERPLGSYVMENILFKISYPAEFHAQTAVECAAKLHPLLSDQIEQIDQILIETHASAIRIIDKTGPLHHPADRDHCLQYMTAVAILKGNLNAEDYEDAHSQDPRIDQLRAKMKVVENPHFSKDYLDPDKRSIANAITITLKDGKQLPKLAIEYPIGHRNRRQEGIPLLFEKMERNFSTRYSKDTVKKLMALFSSPEKLLKMAVSELIDAFVTK